MRSNCPHWATAAFEGEEQRTAKGWVAALISAQRRGFSRPIDKQRFFCYAGLRGRYSPEKWQNGRFPAPVGVGAIL